jgi:hypothetical protein
MSRGNSTAYENLHKKPKEAEKTTGEKWEALPTGTKTAVYGGGVAVAAVGVSALAFYWLRQRRAGASEAKAAEVAEQERTDLMSYRAGEDTTNQGHEYSAARWQKLST